MESEGDSSVNLKIAHTEGGNELGECYQAPWVRKQPSLTQASSRSRGSPVCPLARYRYRTEFVVVQAQGLDTRDLPNLQDGELLPS
jgi:hypothetical protein